MDIFYHIKNLDLVLEITSHLHDYLEHHVQTS